MTDAVAARASASRPSAIRRSWLAFERVVDQLVQGRVIELLSRTAPALPRRSRQLASAARTADASGVSGLSVVGTDGAGCQCYSDEQRGRCERPDHWRVE